MNIFEHDIREDIWNVLAMTTGEYQRGMKRTNKRESLTADSQAVSLIRALA
jgi:hypothetical protein